MSESEQHKEFHLPPNSFVPVSVALALTTTFVGFLMGPVLWILGSVWLVLSLATWAWAARREYKELP